MQFLHAVHSSKVEKIWHGFERRIVERSRHGGVGGVKSGSWCFGSLNTLPKKLRYPHPWYVWRWCFPQLPSWWDMFSWKPWRVHLSYDLLKGQRWAASRSSKSSLGLKMISFQLASRFESSNPGSWGKSETYIGIWRISRNSTVFSWNSSWQGRQNTHHMNYGI